MAEKKFFLVGKISTDNPMAINTALKKAIPQGTIENTETDEFLVKAEFTGENARELNRSLLSELRRVEKKTRLRAEWTSGGMTERFFDYVPKSKTAAKYGRRSVTSQLSSGFTRPGPSANPRSGRSNPQGRRRCEQGPA